MCVRASRPRLSVVRPFGRSRSRGTDPPRENAIRRLTAAALLLGPLQPKRPRVKDTEAGFFSIHPPDARTLLSVRELAPNDRPRERLRRCGARALSSVELL